MNRAGALTPGSAAGLRRSLRRIDVVAITLNTIVGAGIFGLPAALHAAAGSWSLAVLGAALLLISTVALCAAEVASRFEGTGGPVLYAREALGPLGGFTVGWLLYLTRIATFGAIAVVMLDYAAALWPALGGPLPRTLALSAFVLAIALLNLQGVRQGTGLANVLAVLKLAPLVLLAAAGLLVGEGGSVPPTPLPPLAQLSSAFLLAFFACMGFELATVVGGELRRPQQDLPIGILTGFLLAGLLYAGLLLACQATVPELANSRRPLADAALALVGGIGATVVAATAVLSCAGNLSTSILVTPRVLFALAERGDLPTPLARVGAHSQVPVVAIVLTALLVWALTLSGTFVYLATVAVIARMLMYMSICAALPLLRRRGPAPLVMPGGPWLAGIACLACIAVLATADGAALRSVALSLLAGFVLRFAWIRYRKRNTPFDAAEETR